MATQNIAIPTGENASMLAMLANHIFENHNEEMGDAIINKNFVLAWLKSKAESIEVGGLDFAEPVLMTANSNFNFRDRYDEIPSDIQAPTREFRFDPVTLSGTIPINQIHQLMNTGKSRIRSLALTLKQQAESTAGNLINAATWKASPTANLDPESLISLIPTTNTAGTIGGITRLGNTWAQNKVFSTTISSIGSAAGLAAVHGFRATLGGDAKTTPDFAVTTSTIWGLVAGFLDNNRRLTSDGGMAKLGLDTIHITPGCALGYDGNAGLATDGTSTGCPANSMYMLNSRHLFYKVLQGGNMVFEKFSKKNNSLNETSIFHHTYNLTTNLPSGLGVLSAITG